MNIDNKVLIIYLITDIEHFDLISSKNDNDKVNKIRENIISCLINKKLIKNG